MAEREFGIARLEGALTVVEGKGGINREGLAEVMREAIETAHALKRDRADLLAVLYQPKEVREKVWDQILGDGNR